MASKYIKRFKVPENLENVMNDFAKEVLRNQPLDILDFGVAYFKSLAEGQKLDYPHKGENRPENYKRPEKENEIIRAQNKLEFSREDFNRLQRSMDELEKINEGDAHVKDNFQMDKVNVVQVNESQDNNELINIGEEKLHEDIATGENLNIQNISDNIRTETQREINQELQANTQETKDKEIQRTTTENVESFEKPCPIRSEIPTETKDTVDRWNDYEKWFNKHCENGQREKIIYGMLKNQIDIFWKNDKELNYDEWFNNHCVKPKDNFGDLGDNNNNNNNIGDSGNLNNNKINENIIGQSNCVNYNEWFEKHCENGNQTQIKYISEDNKFTMTWQPLNKEYNYDDWFMNHCTK